MPGLRWRTWLVGLGLAGALLGAFAGCGSDEDASGVAGGSSVGGSSVGGNSVGDSAAGATEVAGDEPLVNQGVTCNQDVSSEEAKSIVERVGGLKQPTWTVRFAESTAAGVVVLVSGDLEEAAPLLFEEYKIAAVLGSSEDQARADDFQAVREVVRQVCD